MVNLHDEKSKYNLGLEPIPVGRCTAPVIHSLVVKILQKVDLDVQNHIVASTSDGASVMRSYGNITNIFAQLCINHGIHLAVVDSFYAKKSKRAVVDTNDDYFEGNDEI